MLNSDQQPTSLLTTSNFFLSKIISSCKCAYKFFYSYVSFESVNTDNNKNNSRQICLWNISGQQPQLMVRVCAHNIQMRSGLCSDSCHWNDRMTVDGFLLNSRNTQTTCSSHMYYGLDMRCWVICVAFRQWRRGEVLLSRYTGVSGSNNES